MPDIRMSVIGGYLGSGKTTFLNDILASGELGRVAVVVNDFGSVNIDAQLIGSRGGETLELTNGCICCDLADGMSVVLERLRNARPVPDDVLVEVSGVGDPGLVARWAGHPGFRRNMILVCADVEQVRARANARWTGDTVRAQLAAADHVLLTKTELVSQETTNSVRLWLDQLIPGIPVSTNRSETMRILLDSDRNVPVTPIGEESHSDTHTSWSAVTEYLVDLAGIRDLIGDLPESVVRAKGVLRTFDAPDRRTVLQSSGNRVHVTDGGPWTEGDRSSLVVITVGPRQDSHDLDRRVREVMRASMQPIDCVGAAMKANHDRPEETS